VPFHGEVWIFDNVFDTPKSPIVSAFSTKYLRILNNSIFISPSRENVSKAYALVELSWCEDVEISDNRVIGPMEQPRVVEEHCGKIHGHWGDTYEL